MNTSLKFLTLVFTTALSGALAVALAGLPLPAAFDILNLFGAFVTAFVVLTAFSDYARTSRYTARFHVAPAVPAATKSIYRLAA